MRHSIVALLLLAGCANAPGPEPADRQDPDRALQSLLEGNGRFVAGRHAHPISMVERRSELVAGQKPIAVLLSCADSRVPPELVFDQGLGELFTVRVAGNVADHVVEGSIEYAAKHLGVRLVLVLGHENCGAVKAALEGGEHPGDIATLVEAIRPAVERAKGKPGDPLDNAVRENVRLVVERLQAEKPVLGQLVEKGRLRILGARYGLSTGKVEILR